MTHSNRGAQALAGIAGLAAGASVVGAGLMAYARLVEPNRLDIQHVTMTLPRLAPEFDGYRIAQFSDLHMEVWRNWHVLGQVIDASNAFDPDLVAITGDFVDEDVRPIEDELVRHLSRLKARDAAVAVVGNHDYWRDIDDVRRLIRRSGLIDLSNDVYTLRRGEATFHIAGVDSMLEARARLDLVLDCLPDDGSAAILLAHEPDFIFISAATHRFDLQLSGHSHGGQVRVPLLLNIVLPKFGRRYVIGLEIRDGTRIYTNRGLGMSGLQVRFNCRPELTLLTLRAGG